MFLSKNNLMELLAANKRKIEEIQQTNPPFYCTLDGLAPWLLALPKTDNGAIAIRHVHENLYEVRTVKDWQFEATAMLLEVMLQRMTDQQEEEL